LSIDSSVDFAYIVGQMPGIGSIGQFEQLILTAILSLHDNAYGVTIHGKVGELAQPKQVSLGAVYVTLDRLEDKGFVSSWLTDPTAERGGRAKRCYRVEALGEEALQESAATAIRISEAITQVFGKDWARKWKKEWKKEAG
jgi:PadR family transcriptional regulator, regulatory protein PadR